MVNMDTLLPLIRPDVPQCPDFTIESYIVRTVRDFCEQTRIWREWLNEPVDPGLETYPLEASAEIVAVELVQTGQGVPVRPLSYTLPGQEEDNMDAMAGVQGFTFDPPNVLHLQGTPTQRMELFADVSLRPALTDTQAPQWLMEKYEDAIVSGTLYRLMTRREKPWSDPRLAGLHMQDFRRGVSAARVHKLKKNTNTSLSIKPRPFG